MRRRDVIRLVGGAAVVWPLAARAQQATPVVGFLHGGAPAPNSAVVAAFRKGLSEAGFVEGQNVTVEYRWADGHEDRLPAMAADLIQRRVAVVATPLSTQATFAAKAATATVPIVFGSGADPVALGLVASFSRPGKNITGISIMSAQLGAKRLGVLRELLPAAAHFAVLGNAHNALTEATLKDLKASTLKARVDVLYAGTDGEIDAAFSTLAQNHAEALLIAPDEFFTSRVAQLAALSLRYAVPSAYAVREFAAAGGLMSYGPDIGNAYREVGIYVGRILKGEKPGDLPVSQPTKFELVLNLKTAKALGLAIPPTLLALADEVIE
jgi:putative tryptophan/tyrosine transport system substrate-binding protein